MVDSFAASPAVETPAIRVGDVLGKAWSLFVARIGPFIGLALIAFAPDFLFSLLVPKTSGVAIIGSILQIVCTSLADAAIIYGVVQELRGRGFTFAESLSTGFGRLGPVFGLSLVVGILAGLGALLFLVPGLIVMTMFYVAIPACVAERLGVGDSMKRSAFLTKGNRWRIFGIVLIVILATMIVGGLVGVLVALVGGVTLVDIALYPIQAIAGAFGAVVVGVLYYQLRVVKEGVDIETIAAVFD
jgi:MFS family permease